MVGVLTLTVLTSCSGNPPTIISISLEPLFRRELGETEFKETFSFFVKYSDPDGYLDLANLYLIHQESEQFWELTPDTWLSYTDEAEEFWVGSYSIATYGFYPPPRGEYRIILEDRAGNRDEQRLLITSPPRLKKNFEGLLLYLFEENSYTVPEEFLGEGVAEFFNANGDAFITEAFSKTLTLPELDEWEYFYYSYRTEDLNYMIQGGIYNEKK